VPDPGSVDLYAALGVEWGASAATVRAGYRRAVLEQHPDKLRAGAGEAERARARAGFEAVRVAWGVLGDAGLRRRYDAKGEAVRRRKAGDGERAERRRRAREALERAEEEARRGFGSAGKRARGRGDGRAHGQGEERAQGPSEGRGSEGRSAFGEEVLAAWRRQHAGSAVFHQGYGEAEGEETGEAGSEALAPPMGLPREWAKPVPGTEAYAAYETGMLGPLLDLAASAGVL